MRRALAVMERSALDEMAPWGPLAAVEASRGPAGPSLGAEVGALLRAPLLSIWKVKRHTQLKTSGLTAPPQPLCETKGVRLAGCPCVSIDEVLPWRT